MKKKKKKKKKHEYIFRQGPAHCVRFYHIIALQSSTHNNLTPFT
jgi:hypothetical protein